MAYENYEQWKTTPITGTPFVSVVIPAYNEAERIVPTIGAIASHVSDLGFEWELLVADDGSKDNTVQLVEDLNLVNVRVLKTPQNAGKGSAVQRGMLAARGEYILFTDADNSTPIENISSMLQKLEGGVAQVVVGSRAAEGASESNKSFFRQLMSDGLRALVRTILGIKVSDTQCGFKMYTREAAHRLHGAQTIMGFSFDLEVLYLAGKVGYDIAEVPVDWMDAPGSKVDARKEAVRFIKDMSRIRWQDARGVYELRLKPDFEPVTTKQHYQAKKKSSKQRIAIVSPYPPSKSTLVEYGYHFIEALRQKEDVEHVYILTDELPDGELYPDASEGTTIIPSWRFGAVNNALRIRSIVNKLNVDAVIFNIQFASFADTHIAAALGLLTPVLVRYTTKTQSIVLLHNIMETVDLNNAGFEMNKLVERVTRFAGTITTRALLQADLVAFTIPKYINIINEKYHADNVFLAPHGAFEDVPEPTFSDVNNGKLQIMTFGKFGTYKRVERLIEAYDKLRETAPTNLNLVIAGADSPNAVGYLQNVKEQYAHVPDITFTGYVAEEDVPRIFTESDVVVFPYTSTTGSSGVLHQAGSYGRAVVLPEIGDFAELIKDEGYTGEFFLPDDTASLAQAIDTLLQHPEKRHEQGQQNYLAARGIPIADVTDWYLMHINRIQSER